ncbi:MAG: hypothetical protein LBN98_03640 [Prevotellaceae bacterium]|jgi:hypothetical protein|nr:hypothetical protein [Prevotellaceae bacterium]
MTRNYRKFYALLAQLPGADKEGLVMQFTEGRTDSLTAMHTHEYQLMVAMLDGKVRTQHVRGNEFDLWRKRVMASIGRWLQLCNTEHTADMIKAIACRAAQRKAFNDITLSELRAVYYEFLNKQKVAKRIKNL